MKKNKRLLFIILAVFAGIAILIFLFSRGKSCQEKLDDLIENCTSVQKADILTMDPLFECIDNQLYPANIEEQTLRNKIDYINSINPGIGNNEYRKLFDSVTRVMPKEINIILERSASMKPYEQSDDFSNVFLALDLYDAPTWCYYIDENGLSEKEKYNKFTREITKHNVKWGKDSKFDEMFKMLLENTKANTATFFITDAIVSDPKEAKKLDKSSSVKIMYNSFFNSITEGLKDTKTQNPEFSVSIYRFLAEFKGTYYDFKDSPVYIGTPSHRPFFLFCIGDRRIVEDFKIKVDKNELKNFMPVHQIHFISAGEPRFDFSSRQIIPKENTIDPDFDGNEIFIEVKLKNFPLYVTDSSYLRRHCTVKLNNSQLKIGKISSSSFNVAIDANLLLTNNSLTVELDLSSLPEWIYRYSSPDDSEIRKQMDKTYNLDQLIESIREGLVRDKNGALNRIKEKYVFSNIEK